MGSCYLSPERGGRGHGLAVLSWLRGGHAAVLRPLRRCFTASAGAPGTSERAAWLCLAPAGLLHGCPGAPKDARVFAACLCWRDADSCWRWEKPPLFSSRSVSPHNTSHWQNLTGTCRKKSLRNVVLISPAPESQGTMYMNKGSQIPPPFGYRFPHPLATDSPRTLFYPF